MQASQSPVVKDLVLVGGGHAHVSVLRRFGMRPLPGVRLTLITRDIHTPYSGMLPGYVAGLYGYDECHIDLGPLARFASARLYHAEVEGLDLESRQLIAGDRPPISFDLLSINIGSRPRTLDVPGAMEHAMPVKPIDIWLEQWQRLQERVVASRGPFRVVVVGGGAGGVELALSTQHRLMTLLRENGDDPGRIHYALLTEGDTILRTHNVGVQRRFARILGERGIEIIADALVLEARQVVQRAHEEHDVRRSRHILWHRAEPEGGDAGHPGEDGENRQCQTQIRGVAHR